MKVNISYISSEQEEADLRVKQGHNSLDELYRIITQETYKDRTLNVTIGENKYKLNCKHVFYIESMDDKVWVHTNKKEFEYKKKLYELEEELPESFVRISKSVILNLDQVEHYSPQLNGIMKAVLNNGKEVYISRKYLKTLRYKIGGR